MLRFNFLPVYFLFLVLMFSSSCKELSKTNLPEVKPTESTQSQAETTESKQAEVSEADFDPYFTESTTITTPNGPKSITRSILQDKKGNIWLATWEGIIRYDGKSFTNFTNKEGLRRYRVFTILEDSKGILWFGTIGAGVYRYDARLPDGQGKNFTNFTTKEGLADDKLGCIYEDKAGNIWFGTMGGVSKYDGKTFTNFTTKDGLTDNDINSIVEDKSGKFWFGTRGEASTFDGKTFTKFTNDEGESFTNVRCVIEDKMGNIWLGGNDGLWRYDGDSFINFNTNFVGYMYEDKVGNIWTSSAASRNGNSHSWVLSRYDRKPLPYELPTVTQIKVEENMFFGITEDKEGGIWLGHLNGAYRYDGTSFNDFNFDFIKD